MAKKEKKPVTGADLRFRHLELARRISTFMMDEMVKEKLKPKDIPYVLNDLCKLVVLGEANANKENALFVVQRFTDLNTDIVCLMMRIVADNYGEGVDSLYEEKE